MGKDTDFTTLDSVYFKARQEAAEIRIFSNGFNKMAVIMYNKLLRNSIHRLSVASVMVTAVLVHACAINTCY